MYDFGVCLRCWGKRDTRADFGKRQGRRMGGEGGKQRRLDQLRAAILQAAARRELALRETEREGEFQPRLVHAELSSYERSAVQRLAR
jgi:hypothetical protein